jgi:hypothetical protein
MHPVTPGSNPIAGHQSSRRTTRIPQGSSMDTEQRLSSPDRGDPVEQALDRDIPARRRHSLWAEEPGRTPRMPDPVRNAAVRAVLIVSVTMIQAVIAILGAAGQSWVAAPAMLFTIVSTVVATWSVLDVWVTRQVWNQRNGVVSSPSSAARALRREKRREHRAARAAARARPPRQATTPAGSPTTAAPRGV